MALPTTTEVAEHGGRIGYALFAPVWTPRGNVASQEIQSESLPALMGRYLAMRDSAIESWERETEC